MVVALMRNIMKKGRAQEKWESYRPVCVLVACYKLISTTLYLRVLRVVKPKLKKWNAGFQTRRGYVDNTVVLNVIASTKVPAAFARRTGTGRWCCWITTWLRGATR